MKKSIIIFAVSVSIMLTAASVANASFSKGHTEASLNKLSSSLIVTHIQSWGGLHAWDSVNNVESSPESETTVVSGQVDIGSASAKMWTDNLFVAIESLAEPPPNEWSLAGGRASQRWWFRANETGPLTFTINYLVQQDLETSLAGEGAWIAGGPFLELYYSDWTYIAGDDVWHLNGVSDGGSGSWSYSGTLSISHSFNTDDLGFIQFYTESQGGANTLPSPVIPAPGAVLLSSIGIGLVAWLRRRRTL